MKYYESYYEKKRLCIVMDYAEGGDLEKQIKKWKFPYFATEILEMLRQIASALLYIHLKKILHWDLKPSNLFLMNGKIMIGDFGISKILGSSSEFAKTTLGTPFYLSPEIC